MSQFHLQIITPDGVQFDGRSQQLSVRGTEGELAILAGHLPLVTALAEGECRVYTDDGIRRAHCSGGMLSCTKEITRLFSTDFAWKEEQ